MYNNIVIMIFGLLTIFIFLWYFKSNKSDLVLNEEKIEMEDVFIQEVEKGNKANRIAYIYSLADLMIIKSLFQSEQIPFFCEFEYLSKIKTGLPVTQINNVILNVLEKDINDSQFILKEFIKTKKINKSCKSKIRNICEYVLIRNAVPSAKNCTVSLISIKKENE